MSFRRYGSELHGCINLLTARSLVFTMYTAAWQEVVILELLTYWVNSAAAKRRNANTMEGAMETKLKQTAPQHRRCSDETNYGRRATSRSLY